ncbi:WAP four-disulfide core domain protein 18-like isoform X3 [Gadus macrocephalus]|uniref:WAP four-disulfide core domain protein 18-like isoform X3 n=1 Tax=Gadus macrocephalus TaxID=80720 RepID=UPI0028CB4CBD|nr:WAP four-disulfide core domain protein 18-like isoform X3 [Gadus macrocephalus]
MKMKSSVLSVLTIVMCAFFSTEFSFATETKENVTGKPGVCPPRHWGVGMCAEFCSEDNDCPHHEKCCSNGCGHQCTAPYTVKPGRCLAPQLTNMCAEFCYQDGQCPGEQKCCRTTCGHACSEPC